MRGTWNIIIFAAIPLVFGELVSARVCVLGTEPDGGKVRFVLPPGDPCSCTDIVLGGHNAYAQPRNTPPVYIDTLPMDAEGFRRNLGCAESSDASVVEGQSHAQQHSDCQEVMDAGYTTSGVYNITHKEESMEVYCDMETEHGYMVFQRRINGLTDFDRTWSEYETGFGDLEGEFWWGNKKLRSFTESATEEWELVMDQNTSDNGDIRVRFAEFNVTGSMYVIQLSSLKDSFDGVFASSNMREFSTKDQSSLSSKCGGHSKGGWWYGNCQEFDCNLNGVYAHSASSSTDGSAALQCQWGQITGSEMKMRRKDVRVYSDELVTQVGSQEPDDNNTQDNGTNDQYNQSNGQGGDNNDQGNNDDQGGDNNDQGNNDDQGENQQ